MVCIDAKSTKHFAKTAQEFSNNIQINVQENLYLTMPELKTFSILVTTETSLELQANK